MSYSEKKLSKHLAQTLMAHCNVMICQQATVSGDAEWPKVADAVIEAGFAIVIAQNWSLSNLRETGWMPCPA